MTKNVARAKQASFNNALKRRFTAAFVTLALVAGCELGAAAQTRQGSQLKSIVSRAGLFGDKSGDLADSHAYFQNVLNAPRAKTDYTKQVTALLQRMTLPEKVGQMTQLTVQMVLDGSGENARVNPEKLQKAVKTYGIGSILNAPDEAVTLPVWRKIIFDVQTEANRSRLKIPILYGVDSVHGATFMRGATVFPQPVAQAATWNPTLVQRIGEITAAETRAAGIRWNFSPVLDVARQPLWSRVYETFGEDTYLATVLGAATVRGYEGADVANERSTAACLKHFIGYSAPASGRDRTPAIIPENVLREVYLLPFRAAVDAGAHSVMINSGDVNGTPAHASRFLLTDVLRGELGFKGLAVSDYADIKLLVSRHRVAADEKDATRIAVMAGVDMSMVPKDYGFADNLIQLVTENKVPMSRIDTAVRRILTLKFELGLFDDSLPETTGFEFGSAASRQISLQAARESLTLLKNQNDRLPLAKNSRILVTGATADSLVSLNNGWTLTWQGTKQELYPKDKLTILGALRQKFGAENVVYAPGARIENKVESPAAVITGDLPKVAAQSDANRKSDDELIKEAAAAARDVDAAIVCVGEGAYAETPGNINDLMLDANQLRLAEAIISTGKPVVLVLVEGRPRIIRPLVDRAAAILMAYNPGMEGGAAIADVLAGDYNPNGKLPFTYPRNNIFLPYDHKISEHDEKNPDAQPEFEFGYGLSYTTFAYTDLRLKRETLGANEDQTVSVRVTNTGQRAGMETVQLYLRDVVASVVPPVKKLKRFAKINLAPGKSQTLEFTLTKADFAFVGADNKTVVEPGEFEVMVGSLKQKFVLVKQ